MPGAVESWAEGNAMATYLPPILLLLLAAALPAAVYEVGAGKAHASLAALPGLSPGDEVRIFPGTYAEVRRWTVAGTAAAPITIRGVGATRPLFDATGKDVSGSSPNPRAVFQIEASHVVVEHLEFANARNGNNGAGVRITGTVSDVTVRDCRIRDNDMGMMSDGCDAVLIDGCEIDHNGTASFSGFSHNLYLGGTGITIRGCSIHDALYGQNVKSRAHFMALLYNRIADSQDGEVGLVDAADTATAQSNAVLIGNVIRSKDRGGAWNSGRFILFGAESGFAHNGTLVAVNNTCIAGTASIIFLASNRAEAGIIASNNVFVGSTHLTSAAGTLSGAGNWAPGGATIPAGFSLTTTGASPGFVDPVSDLRLASGSPCIGAGVPGTTYRDGTGAVLAATASSTPDGIGLLGPRSDAADPAAGAYPGPSAGGGATPPPAAGAGASSGGGGGCGLGSGLASLLLACALGFRALRLR
jgi:hypothetical protein